MHIPLWTRSPYTARHNGPALIERTDPTQICLPIQLQTVVPSCALQCLQTFVANNYNVLTCTSTADINFLCTNPTNFGLTIGEGSLQCLISNCIGADIQTQSGYTVCDGIQGAVPNMAGTITATISAITTLFSSSESLTPITTSAPVASTTSKFLPTETSSEVPAASQPSSAASFTTSFPSSPISTNSPSKSGTISTPLSTFSSSQTSAASSGSISNAVSGTTSSSIITSSRTATRTSESSSVSRSATSSATAAAATEGATESGLSASAIAGISTAAVLVAALILGYLAYWLCIKRKERRRRSQRFTTIFMPPNADNAVSSVPSTITENAQSGLFKPPARRFYSAEPSQRYSWRESVVRPNDIGIAVAPSTRASPKHRIDTRIPDASHISWPSPYTAMQIDRSGSAMGDSRWSVATSFDEDIEAQAQNQDLPALASPRTRASSRSFSSIRIEKPPPLQLSKTNQRPEMPARGMITLTPIYDNGTFEPSIRQVIDGNDMPAGPIRLSRDRQALNFSRREPSLARTSQDDTRPITVQTRQPNQFGRFPIKPTIPPRKQSETTNRTVSVHTEIDEDSTPEDEDDDKQLKAPRQPSFPIRVPLKDIQYPQIPRPAATSKQAENPHSPRNLTIRRVDLLLDPSPPQKSFAERAQTASTSQNFIQPNVSSSSSLVSLVSESPVFPTPPPRNPARLTRIQPQNNLRSQIADSYRVASQPVTAKKLATTSPRRNSEFPPSAYPGAARFGGDYDSPSLQRISTGSGSRGRPLAQRLQAQGYMPRPPMRREAPTPKTNLILSPPPRNKARPIDPRSGDIYFTVGQMRS